MGFTTMGDFVELAIASYVTDQFSHNNKNLQRMAYDVIKCTCESSQMSFKEVDPLKVMRKIHALPETVIGFRLIKILVNELIGGSENF